MEDRRTPTVYLEMTDRSPEDYARDRLPEVAKRAGVQRGSWWSTCIPGRKDLALQLTMPEFSTLGLYEATSEFVPPDDLPPDVRGVCFRSCPRPGQGTLSPGPTLGLLIVLLSARTPGERQTLRDWADFVHLRDIAAASPEHFTMITPYENVVPGAPNFMHLYELDTDDPESAFRKMVPATVGRIGAWGTHSEEEWFLHEALVLNYANTFQRLGVRDAG